MPPTWLQLAEAFATHHGLDPRTVDVLRAFDGPTRPMAVTDFAALEAVSEARRPQLKVRILESLRSEIDEEQAHIFANRFEAIHERLHARDDDEARVLRVGLTQRVEQVLDGPGDGRALRIRALVDYLYSHVALLEHTSGADLTPIGDWVADAVWSEVAPGVAHATLDGLTSLGPQHLNLLKIAPGAVQMCVRDAYAEGAGPLASFAHTYGAIAAISGGFFLYSEPDIRPPSHRHDPVGLVVRDGQVLHPGLFRRTCLVQDPHGTWGVRQLGLHDHQVWIDGWHAVRDLNPITRTTHRTASGIAIVGTQVVDAGAHIEVPLNGVVLAWSGPAPAQVRWRLSDPNIHHAVAGGPALIREGIPGFSLFDEDFRGTAPPQTFTGDETGDRNLLPRMAVGVRADGTLIAVAVDGRNLQRALGLPLAALGEVLGALGCVDGLNLDGGSSKRMVVQGRAVDLPSTSLVTGEGPAAPPRPVHTAVLFRPADPALN
ncbi:MAG: phosphodiester glycosidase family protein [Myxococcota bacterium]